MRGRGPQALSVSRTGAGDAAGCISPDPGDRARRTAAACHGSGDSPGAVAEIRSLTVAGGPAGFGLTGHPPAGIAVGGVRRVSRGGSGACHAGDPTACVAVFGAGGTVGVRAGRCGAGDLSRGIPGHRSLHSARLLSAFDGLDGPPRGVAHHHPAGLSGELGDQRESKKATEQELFHADSDGRHRRFIRDSVRFLPFIAWHLAALGRVMELDGLKRPHRRC